MKILTEIGLEGIQQLLKAAQIGWWKADFKCKTYTCSEFIQDLLGLSSSQLGIMEFYNYIREDYRQRIISEFVSSKGVEGYEQIFPIVTHNGERWILTRLFRFETLSDGAQIAWGFIQCVHQPTHTEDKTSDSQINELIYQQHSISRSLLSFVKSEDITNVINKILEDILHQFHGSRVYIFEYDFENKIHKCTFEVVGKNISPQKDNLQALGIEDTPWWTQKLVERQQPILLNTIEELPREAKEEKNILKVQGIKSLMVVPMIVKTSTWGYLGIDIVDSYRSWRAEDYQWFASLANIISLCLELRKSENEVRIEREYFRDLYEHMPVAYLRLKLLYNSNDQITDFIFIDINPAFNWITGKKASDYLNHKGSEFNLKVDTKEFNELLAASRESGYRQMTYHNETETRYYRVILYSAFRDEVVCMFSDMTETLKAHKALYRSEKTLRNLFTNIPVGIEIYDKNGILVDINDKDLTTFGLTDKQKALGVNLFENPNFSKSLRQKLLNKEDLDFELKYDFSKVGPYYSSSQKGVKNLLVRAKALYDEEGNFENYLLIVIDNTENLTAHNRIRNFESLFSLIAEFAKIGYFKWNPLTHEGFALNQWYKNVGEKESTPFEEIIGIYPHLHPEDAQKAALKYQNLINGQAKGLKLEARVIQPDGSYKWIRSNITVKEYDPAHNFIEIIGVNFDITEQKQIENELMEAKNKAETLDKLKSAFLANMSHEIRTPLNAIVGFSNLLADTEDLEERHQYLQVIQENNDLLLQLISDILDLSKIEAGTFDFTYTDIDVNNLCTEIIRSLKMKTAEGVELCFGEHLPTCQLYGDKNRLTQIITNFINNALKFTVSGNITLGYQIIGKVIEFYVSDTGIGIPKAKSNEIFGRFVKLNSFIHGTGLGLSICKSLVEQMEGEIGVESEEGKGSRFWFRIPYMLCKNDTNPLEPGNTHENNSATAPKHLRILVAEDTDSNYLLISTILKKEYEIIRAMNGAEAIERYKNDAPALILMDIKMPVMDGLEATRRIREIDKNIPIFALTAFAFDSDRQKTIDAGCNEYLTKPISPQILRDTLKKYL